MLELRKAAGLSRERLAAKAGVSTSTVARLELRDQAPGLDLLAAIAEALDTTVPALLTTETTDNKAIA